MGKGKALMKSSGNDIAIRHLSTPCGKRYSGHPKQVEMINKMHSKICYMCKDSNRITSSIKTRTALDNKSMVNDYIDDIRKQVQ